MSSLNKGIVDIKNPPVKGVLKGISLDSVKHAELYASALALLTNVSQALTQENLDAQKALVEKHIRSRSGTHQENRKHDAHHRKQQGQIPPRRHPITMRRRHHALLKTVLEIIVHGETITEADWWKMLWEERAVPRSPRRMNPKQFSADPLTCNFSANKRG